MARTDLPKAQWETLKTDPLGWKLRYVQAGIILGEPAYMKGENPTDTYADANHLLWDGSILSSIQVRKQGQNPIEVSLSDPAEGGQRTWVPLSTAPYFGPVDNSTPPKPVKPTFPSDSIWSAW